MSTTLPGTADNPPGEVITFYSYKGGTGRTMALANIAYLMAKRRAPWSERDVLMLDWDLEAPGLHRYARQLLVKRLAEAERAETTLDAHPGLIDLFLELDDRIPQTDDPYQGQTAEEARAAFAEIALDRFIIPTDQPGLFLLKAGRFDDDYSYRVNTFDWERLYVRSPRLMRVFAEILAERFAYVLIDSRTGVTDISNICTMLMPDKLVLVFTPNRQSLTGVKHLIEQAVAYREQADDPRPLGVFPLPSRIDVSLPRLERTWRRGDAGAGIQGYQPLFEALFTRVYDLKECNLDAYFDEVKIQHVADYAYGEEIAAFAEESDDRFSLARTYENFISWLMRSGTREMWENMFDVYLSYNSQDKPVVREIAQKLKKRGVKVWFDEEQIKPGGSLTETLVRAITSAKTAAVFIGSKGIGAWQQQELRMFVKRGIEPNIPIIPALLPNADYYQIPESLRDLNPVHFNSPDDQEALDMLIWGITGEKPER